VKTDTVQNIDNTEREKFDSVAAGWWDPEGPFRPLHDLNPARLKFIADRVPMSWMWAAEAESCLNPWRASVVR
jgi:2-polyprenyl-6-hydroxyphenyl methylase/3-demethylubiquinone-9 3-methyltransferase